MPVMSGCLWRATPGFPARVGLRGIGATGYRPLLLLDHSSSSPCDDGAAPAHVSFPINSLSSWFVRAGARTAQLAEG